MRASGSSNVLAETIEISDSDDETLRPQPSVRKRSTRDTWNEVDIMEGEQRATRRQRTDGGDGVAQSGSRRSRRNGVTTEGGDIIVIDD